MLLLSLTHAQAGRFLLGCWISYVIVWTVAMFGMKRTVAAWSLAHRIGYLASWTLVWVLVFRIPAGNFSRLIGRGPAASLAVCVTCLAGLCIAFWARYVLGRNWSGNITLKENHELVESGPYRFVRHPIYTGLLLMWLASAIYQGTAMAFLGVAVFFLAHVWKLRQEEALMRRQFPEAYPAYCGRTKALIPGIF